MSSASKLCITLFATLCGSIAAEPFRVCAEPNNMPYSNGQQQGFENRLATMYATDSGTSVEYVWHPLAPEYVRRMLKVGICDAVMGLPMQMGIADHTDPYYRSGYVFVSRRDRHVALRSLDDAPLQTMKIGVNTTEEAGLPPAVAIAHRGLAAHLVSFSIFGRPLDPDPQANLIHAVEDGKVDVAAMWGPIAGYYARASPIPLDVTLITPGNAEEGAQLDFDMAIAVRRGNTELCDRLNAWLQQHRGEIRELLGSYGVPLVAAGPVKPQNQ